MYSNKEDEEDFQRRKVYGKKVRVAGGGGGGGGGLNTNVDDM